MIGMVGCVSHNPDTRQPISNQNEAELIIVSGTSNRNLTMAEMSRALPIHTLTVDDPVYQRRKRYEGFWLEDVLNLVNVRPGASNVLVFSALDGYQARLSQIPAPPTRALIAVRDVDQKQGWETLRRGKETLTPGPFYLVWRSQRNEATDSHLPWPYQLTRIELRNAVEAQRRLLPVLPGLETNVSKGFELFTKYCLACHSLNLEGGVLGPELNVPKNITEYLSWDYLVEFIKAPSSFRARSKMPDFGAQLSASDINDILNYLGWMRNSKAPVR